MGFDREKIVRSVTLHPQSLCTVKSLLSFKQWHSNFHLNIEITKTASQLSCQKHFHKVIVGWQRIMGSTGSLMANYSFPMLAIFTTSMICDQVCVSKKILIMILVAKFLNVYL